MTWLYDVFRNAQFRLGYYAVTRRSSIVLSAGMPRSGSTWLFNAARLLLQSHGDLSSGWIGDWSTLPHRSCMLLKVHDYASFLARHAGVILYSYRDVRDALASSKRKFGAEPTLDLARRWLASDRRWREQATFVLRFESMLDDPAEEIARLARVLRVSHVDPDEVVQQLAQLSDPRDRDAAGGYDRETLLHPGHITDGRHGSWHGWLEPALLEQIEKDCGPWLEENGYLPGPGVRQTRMSAPQI